MSIIKNIVNIQDNRLDYSINGTNSLRYIFRGTEHFRLTEVGGTSVCQFIAQKALDDGNFIRQTVGSTNADFIGRVSNIDNHPIENLNNVVLTNLSNGDSLVYDGTNFVNGPGGVGSITLQDTSGSTSTLSFSSNFSILGTSNQIETQVTNNQVTISLPTNMVTPGSLTVNGLLTANGDITAGTGLISAGNLSITNNASITNDLTVGSDVTINGNLTVNGTQTIINTEIKLIEDPLIELGYSDSLLGSTVNDIGFFGQYQADNYAGLYYDVSSTSFRIFDALGSNAYTSSLRTGTTVPTNSNAASIIAKNFETSLGSVGETIFTDSRVFTTNTIVNNIVTIPLTSILTAHYGSGDGIFSGKLIAYSYTNDSSGPGTSFFNSSVTLLNYVYFSYNGSTKTSFTVEIEDKTPNYAYINFSYLAGGFSSDIIINTNDAAASLMTEGMPFVTIVKILPIISTS